MAIRYEQPRLAPPDRGVQPWSRLWLVVIGLGVAVVAAIAVTKSGFASGLPGGVALGVTFTLYLATSLAAVARDGPRGGIDHDARGVRADEDLLDDRFRAAARVYSWRQEQLAALGVTGDAAILVAADTRFDVHELERLLAAGCPLPTALRILRPA